MVSHLGLSNYLRWCVDAYGVARGAAAPFVFSRLVRSHRDLTLGSAGSWADEWICLMRNWGSRSSVKLLTSGATTAW